jgi:hypothetical protein
MADQPRQADGTEVDQRHAESAAEDAEHGALADHAHVGPKGQLHAAGDGMPFDCGNHRLAETQPAWAHRSNGLMAAELAPLQWIAGRDHLQVRAGTEVSAHAGEDRDRGAFIRIEGEKRLEQHLRRCAVDGVAPLRPIDRNNSDRSVALDENQRLIAHAKSP